VEVADGLEKEDLIGALGRISRQKLVTRRNSGGQHAKALLNTGDKS